MKRLLPTTAAALVFAGLVFLTFSMTGCRTGAPTEVEEAWFKVTTNQVPVVTVLTNQVQDPATGEVLTEVTAITNVVEEYEFAPGDRVIATADAARNIGNSIAPGAGSIAGLVVTGLGWLYAGVRSRRKGKALAAVMQGLETARKVLQETHQGRQADKELVNWLVRHQMQAGVLVEVSTLIQRTVNSEDAKAAAKLVMDFVKDRLPADEPTQTQPAV